MIELLDTSADPLRELSDALDLGVVILDTELRIRHWNRWMEAASGRLREDVLEQSLIDIFPSVRGGRREEALRRAVSGESIILAHRFHEYLLPLPARGVPEYPLMQQSVRLQPILREGKATGAMVFIQDVTERVAREEQLRAAMKHAQAASEAKSAFIATTSHELRTPLSAIIGYTDLIATEVVGPVTERQRDFLGRVKLSTLHLLSLIEQILTFSRMEAGREPVEPVECDLVALAHEAVALVEPQALRAELTLNVAAPETLPAITDPQKVRQVLVNLLGNAVKFTERGTVTLELVPEGDWARYQVRDTGPGIDPGHLERIFEAFTQADQSKTRRKGGAGLGLAVSRRLVDLIGGTVTVDSALGQGSVFTVRIPLQARTPEPQDMEPADLLDDAPADPGAVSSSGAPTFGRGDDGRDRSRRARQGPS